MLHFFFAITAIISVLTVRAILARYKIDNHILLFWKTFITMYVFVFILILILL